MRKLNKQPYVNIINLKEEQKEYVKLCNNKSKKFQDYIAWELHVKKILHKFSSSADLYNFKKYCIIQDRVFSDAPNLFGTYVALLIALILDRVSPELSIMGLILLFLYSTWCGITQHRNVTKGSGFFKDIIEMIDNFEKEQTKDD